MKVYLEQTDTKRTVDRATTAYRNTQAARTMGTANKSDYALGISGTVMDNNAYTGHGKTAEEVMQDAGQIDVATQRDYMTVMSNTMSEEDFSRLKEEGCRPGDMEIQEVVTIVDKIKAELVKGGTQVVGYTDDLDEETLLAITGSEAFAQELKKQFAQQDIPLTKENVTEAVQAYRQAAGLQTPEDGTVKYMVENQIPPTIDGLYKSGYSSLSDSSAQGHGYYSDDSAYYAKKAEDYDWKQLEPQMEKVISQAGLSVDETTLEGAKWLIEMGVPLTGESISALYEIWKLSLPQNTEDTLRAIASAISDGRHAVEANLADPRSNLEKAEAYVQAFAQISEETADQAAQSAGSVTLRSLQQAQKEYAGQQTESGQSGSYTEQPESAEQDDAVRARQLTVRRQLEEIRLKMTTEANLRLLRKGISIDTTELSRLVEELKEAETQYHAIRWGETDAAQAQQNNTLLQETQRKISLLPQMPAAVLGRFVSEEELFSVNQVYEAGEALRSSYEAAGRSYEALMTAPRSDMGDSIRKAFRNVDAILQDMDMELSEDNRKAVRILGYNSMEITPENVEKVREKDMELRTTIRKMTPQAALQAIRDGVNPLTVSMEELNRYLDASQQQGAQEEKISKYLYKLEQNKEILPQEREAYVGIFRMFRQLEKADDAAVGSLIGQGSELTFENLLTAMRSSRKKGMDYTVDDSFSGVDGRQTGRSISEQIHAGFTKYHSAVAGEIADTMEPEFLMQMELSPDMSLEQFAQEMAQAQTDEELDRAYQQEQRQSLVNLQETEETVLQELLDYGQPITAQNLHAAAHLRGDGAELYRRLNHFSRSADKNIGKEKGQEFLEHLNGKEEAGDAYEEMQQTFLEVVQEAQQDNGIAYLDLKALQGMHRQLSLASNLAKEENYQIPVEIEGELTAINLKILHGTEGGKVSLSMRTEVYGEVAAQLGVRKDTLSGYVACDSAEGTRRLEEKLAMLELDIQNELQAGEHSGELKVGNISVIESRDLHIKGYQAQDLENNTEIETASLYRIAKALIRTVSA